MPHRARRLERSHSDGERAPGGLTAREIEVRCLVVRVASNKEIAVTLVISEKTARNHVQLTYAKIGVEPRRGEHVRAPAWARRPATT